MINTRRPGPTWLFDLDNTLHDASHAIFPAIHVNMSNFLARVLGSDGKPADAATVDAARVAYWRRYGATLLGVIKHHDVRAEEFLREAHQFDDLRQMIRTERGLSRVLDRLPGRKILLTNGPNQYSRDVMSHIGVQRHFSRHIAIESMVVHRQLRPKPSKILLRQLMKRERLAPHNCILVEDTAETLKAAKQLGLRTVWITRYLRVAPGVLAHQHRNLTKRPVYVDVKVQSLKSLFKNLRRLGGARQNHKKIL